MKKNKIKRFNSELNTSNESNTEILQNKIITAINFFYMMNSEYNQIPHGFELTMVEFAKQHVKAALNEAALSADTKQLGTGRFEETFVDEDSILNAYPFELIK